MLYVFAILSVLIGVVLSALLAGAAAFYWYRLKNFQGVPQTTISDMKGPAKIRGVVAADDDLPIPFVKKKGVYYHVLIEQEKITGKVYDKTHMEWKILTKWEPAFEDRKAVPVRVSDDTGEVDVNLVKADVILKKEDHALDKTEKVLPAQWIKWFPELRDLSAKNIRAWRCRMEYLCIDEEVLVTGMVQKGKQGLLPKLVGGETHLVVSDLDADELERHYKKVILLCAIGAPIGGTIGCLVGGAAFFFAR